VLKKIVGCTLVQRGGCGYRPAHPALFFRAPCPGVEYDHRDAWCAPTYKNRSCRDQHIQYYEWMEAIATLPASLRGEVPVLLLPPDHLARFLLLLSRAFLELRCAQEWEVLLLCSADHQPKR